MSFPAEPEHQRWERKIVKTDGCWIYTGSTDRKGYGLFYRKLKGKRVSYRASRYAWEIVNGPIPAGLWVLHRCDLPSCVNPDHLFLGDVKLNSQDMMNKGRHRFGHIYSYDWAQTIRDYKANNPECSGVDIAKKFNTSKSQVSRVLNNKIWAALGGV